MLIEGIPSGIEEYVFCMPHMYDTDDILRRCPICDQVLDYLDKHRSLRLDEFVKRWGAFFKLKPSDNYKNYEWVSAQSFKYRRKDYDTYSFFVSYKDLKEVDYGKGDHECTKALGAIRLVPGSSCD